MKHSSLLLSLLAVSLVTSATALRLHGQGGANSPEAQARQKQQLELEAATPKLQITEEVLTLTVPGHTIGETEGVARNSKGHLFVYSRTGTGGSSLLSESRILLAVARKSSMARSAITAFFRSTVRIMPTSS